MTVAGLLFTIAFLWGMYGDWWGRILVAIACGAVVGFRRPWLLLCLVGGMALGMVKTVLTPDRLPPGYIETSLTVTSHPVLSPDGTYRHQCGSIVFFSDSPWLMGDTLAIRGKIRSRGGNALLIPFELTLIKRRPITGFLSELYLFWQQAIRDHIPSSPFRSLLFALVTGNRLFLDYSTRREFQISGIFHLLAISGLHLMLLAGGIRALFSPLLGDKRSWLLASLVVSLYTLVLGVPAPMVRATLFLWGYMILWEVHPETSWIAWIGLSAALCCLFLPRTWLGVSFFLSFSAVMGILLLAQPLSLVFQKLWPFDHLLAITLAANLATLPLLAMTFHEVSIVSPLANLCLVPVFPFFLGGCFLVAFLALVGTVPSWIITLLSGVWEVMARLVHLFSLGGGLSFSLSPTVVAWLYTAWGLWILWRLLGRDAPKSTHLSQKKG